MIHFIKGTLSEKLENSVIVDNGGIGYEIFVPDNSNVYLINEKESVKLYTYMAVREDDMSLYGFSDKEGLKLFRLLITVSGVGAKAGMALLSAMPPAELRKAIAFEDTALLTKANGIGKKTAQRIVLELKDKMGAVADQITAETINASSAFDNIAQDARNDALNALLSLGYSRLEAVEALSFVSDGDLTAEQYIKAALKKLF
ncbi:MAG: Holliday junction branch migration protein RuvA [Eubacteriales bacterium]|nr:Holliday junction branch migration protein RuvA [Eubacteriales bacterium]MDD4389613.1 Holliday junction branch migration protein RuvA [Eubacteriales bacterium]